MTDNDDTQPGDSQQNSPEDVIAFLHQTIEAGEHWYIALLKSMARWNQPEEVIGERQYRYLIGTDAFDWLLLAERLLDEVDSSIISPHDRERLLFHGQPPLEMDEEEFQLLIGTPKYQAYLNYLYGVDVEEALQLAVEEEVAKEGHSHVWSSSNREGETAFQRLYGRPQEELLQEFCRERKMDVPERFHMSELKEFTYWLFKLRVRGHEGARVASDTRKGLAALSRVEAAYRQRAAALTAASAAATEDDLLYEHVAG
jgi:hypothetical protein